VQGRYDPWNADHKAYVRRRYKRFQGKKIVAHPVLRREVESRLMDDQSPQAIARRITRRERHLPSISKNAIYRFIASPYGRRIETHRRHMRGRRRGRRPRTGRLEDRTFIDRRPACIQARSRIGDAEADFIVSGKTGRGILLVVVDRRARATFLERILPVSIRNLERAFLKIQVQYQELRTVTTDNDLLFAHHEELARLLDVRIFFCHPYHSWEKGSVEHVNGVIRRNVPKGSDLSRYSSAFFRRLEAKLNRRPMEVLGDRTPQETLDRYRRRVTKNKKRLAGRCSD
jgi:IS30 family transposase